MKIRILLFIFLLTLSVTAQKPYFPLAGSWERRTAEQAGFDGTKLKEAIDFAIANEPKTSKDLELAHYQILSREPFGDAIGPFKERSGSVGMIVRNGYVIAEWGDTRRVDMTFSVTKSFLSATVGIAFGRKMIRSLQDPVLGYEAPTFAYDPNTKFGDAGKLGSSRLIELFSTEHNRKITWEHLLRQTSDWEGTLWGKPDWADRPEKDVNTWLTRKRNEPGTVYKYNDVRVNVLALAALNVWRRPLPQVLKENLMDEIGASDSWRWFGYENSWVVIDGQIVQSVSGGGHWGGGMFISAQDMARFGLLTARGGKWRDKQILPEEFVRQAKTPGPANDTYGFMNWFLNTGHKLYPSAPVAVITHIGSGTNIIYADPENDIVMVVRWIENDKITEFVEKVYASLKK
ncbi:MAG TPA: serine hydrolase [Pyrinomonadaceae bacterium]|jgi:CubicO group peptidase (beta-lactamase class C family)|nr:serine hydrolase [Pyrinomonadaceae bacterium]